MSSTMKKILIPLVTIVGILILKFTFGYIVPFILAFLLAILIEPLVEFFQKKARFSRGIAVAVVLFLILIILAVFLVAGISKIYVELDKLAKNMPDYQTLLDSYKWFTDTQLDKYITRLELSETQQQAVDHILQDLYSTLTNTMKNFIRDLLGLLTKLPHMVTVVMISLIATFFVSRDRRMFAAFFWRLFPKKWQKKLRFVKDEITDASIGFIRAELILISITTIIAIVGLEILNSDYALIFGFSAGILDLIPVIGPSLIFLPWAIISMISGNFSFGVGLLFIYGISVIVREIAEAKIIGGSIGIHPLATLFAIYVGVKAFGVSGFFIGPAVVIVLKALIKAEIITIFAVTKE